MKSFLVFCLLSSVSLAHATRSVETILSFNATDYSFESLLPDSQNVSIQYQVDAVSLPKISDSDFSISEHTECSRWINEHSRDEAICSEWKKTGKFLVTMNLENLSLYKLTEVVTDLNSGDTRTRALHDVKGSVYFTKVMDRPMLPKNLELDVLVSSEALFGCGVENLFITGPVLEALPVNLGVCTYARGSATLLKSGGKYELVVSSELELETTIEAFWNVQNFPYATNRTERLWGNQLSSPTIKLQFR